MNAATTPHTLCIRLSPLVKRHKCNTHTYISIGVCELQQPSCFLYNLAAYPILSLGSNFSPLVPSRAHTGYTEVCLLHGRQVGNLQRFTPFLLAHFHDEKLYRVEKVLYCYFWPNIKKKKKNKQHFGVWSAAFYFQHSGNALLYTWCV